MVGLIMKLVHQEVEQGKGERERVNTVSFEILRPWINLYQKLYPAFRFLIVSIFYLNQLEVLGFCGGFWSLAIVH